MKTATEDRILVDHSGLGAVEGALINYFIKYNVEYEIEQSFTYFRIYCYQCKELTEDRKEHQKMIEDAVKNLHLKNYKIDFDENKNSLYISVAGSSDVRVVNVPPTPIMHNSNKKQKKRGRKHGK